MVTKQDIEKILKEIPDPELGVSILDLGLVYNIDIMENKVEILMTLTTIGCPLFDQIAGPIRQEIGKLKGIQEVVVHLTFEPAWNPTLISEEGKAQLGMV